jgi:hypothetical protein
MEWASLPELAQETVIRALLQQAERFDADNARRGVFTMVYFETYTDLRRVSKSFGAAASRVYGYRLDLHQARRCVMNVVHEHHWRQNTSAFVESVNVARRIRTRRREDEEILAMLCSERLPATARGQPIFMLSACVPVHDAQSDASLGSSM